jgi:histidinol phosphatase-like PHP family hydrolase
MNIDSDWHIHSRNSCDEAALAVCDLTKEARTAGIVDFGLTDHLHTELNIPELEDSRREYLDNSPGPRFHFGVEVSCVSRWELDEIGQKGLQGHTYGLRAGGPPDAAPAIALTPELIERFSIEYVVAGTHWPLYVPLERDAVVRNYHRQNMYLVTHPLVDIVAHPWWWMGHWREADGMYRTDPWLDDFGKIPASMHDEFAAAAAAHGTVVEANLGAMLLTEKYTDAFKQQYLEYLARLVSRGVQLSIGSDCHGEHYRASMDFQKGAAMLARAGLGAHAFWRLPPRI